MGETAENLARVHQIARRDQEEFAVRSHRKAADAQAAGRLAAEIVPAAQDDARSSGRLHPAETTVEKLAELKPAFDAAGTVTAGTSSPLTDGASAVLVTSAEFARRTGSRPGARCAASPWRGARPDHGDRPRACRAEGLDRAGLRSRTWT